MKSIHLLLGVVLALSSVAAEAKVYVGEDIRNLQIRYTGNNARWRLVINGGSNAYWSDYYEFSSVTEADRCFKLALMTQAEPERYDFSIYHQSGSLPGGSIGLCMIHQNGRVFGTGVHYEPTERRQP